MTGNVVTSSKKDKRVPRSRLPAVCFSASSRESPPVARPRTLITGVGLLPERLQLVVAELAACLGEGLAGVDRRADLLFDGVDLCGRGEHGILVSPRDHEHAVRVPAQQVAWGHARGADVDDDVSAFDLDAVLAGPHRVAAAVDG